MKYINFKVSNERVTKSSRERDKEKKMRGNPTLSSWKFSIYVYRINLKILSLSIIRDNRIKWWCMLKTLTAHRSFFRMERSESRHVSIKLCVRKWKILIKFSPRHQRAHTFECFQNQYEFEYACEFFIPVFVLFCICFCLLFQPIRLKRCVPFIELFFEKTKSI